MKEAAGGEMGAVWNHQLRPDAPLALLLTGENIPTLIGLSATHPTNLTILGQPRRRPEGPALSLARSSH
jgi:hypothetical protein